MQKIESLLPGEKESVKAAVDIIKTIKFDRNKVVQIKGKEYR